MKKDFASLYDVTAAGHLQAEETIADGVRELEEELGLKRNIEDLTFGAVIQDTIQIGDWIDREFTHVYFHTTNRRSGNISMCVETTVDSVV